MAAVHRFIQLTIGPILRHSSENGEILLRRAHIDDVVAWGESLDHLLECKSKTLVTGGFMLGYR